MTRSRVTLFALVAASIFCVALAGFVISLWIHAQDMMQVRLQLLEAQLAAASAEINLSRQDLLQAESYLIAVQKALDADRRWLTFLDDLVVVARSENPRLSAEDAYIIARSVWEASVQYDFDPYLITAVISHESGFQPRVVGGVGEIGLMQILPLTGEFVAAALDITGYQTADLYNPALNIRMGVYYLSRTRAHLRSYADENWSEIELALMAYNRGPRSTLRELVSGQVVDVYPKAVIANYNRIQRQYPKAGD